MNLKPVSDVELLEYLAGRLSAERRAEVQRALVADASLGQRLAEFQRTWDALGPWTVDAAARRDLLPGVLERLRRKPADVVPLRARWPVLVRAAAMWLLAAGLGVAAARMLPSGTPAGPQTAHAAAEVDEQEAAEALNVDVLCWGGEVGLARSVLEGGQ
jgi:anti-sigma factor RsiW